MRETQRTIVEWARETFGEPAKVAVLDKLEDEWEEMHIAYADEQKAKEAADVYVVLVQYVNLLGYDLHDLVDAKMDINRKRKWDVRPGGVAQHIPEEP